MTFIFCRDTLDWLAELDLNQHESDKEGQKWLQSEIVMMSKVMNTTVMRRVAHSISFKCIEAAYGNLYENTRNMHSYLAVQQDNLINWIKGWNHKINELPLNLTIQIGINQSHLWYTTFELRRCVAEIYTYINI